MPAGLQIHLNPQSILLQTAFIKVLNTEEKYFANCRVIFDSGSQRTYCTEVLKDTLNLKPIRSELILMKRFATEEGVLTEIDVVQICVKSKTKSTNVYIEALSIPFLCLSIQGKSIETLDFSKYNYLKNLDFTDKYTSDNSEKSIDILIGIVYYFNFVTGKIKRGPPGCPVAIESNFGWILSGPNGTTEKKGRFVSSNIANSHTMFVNNITHKIDNDLNLKDSIQKFWEVENVEVDEHPVFENFKQTISFDRERCVTALPFKPFHKPLPDNYTLSKHRLSILKTKLDKNEELKQEYNQVFDNYLKDSIIEKVADDDYGVVEKTHYLPHRAVVRCDKEITKVRVVFDASAKNGNEPSLNDCLYAGPCLRQLYDILVRFRLHIILMSDIKQAFLNVVIHDEDRDYLRFLWYDDPFSTEPNIIILRFLRVVFGIISSPFLLNATIKYHLERYLNDAKNFVEKFLNDLYVDDSTSGFFNVKEAYDFYMNAKRIMKEGGFELRKWASNSV